VRAGVREASAVASSKICPTNAVVSGAAEVEANHASSVTSKAAGPKTHGQRVPTFFISYLAYGYRKNTSTTAK
jgi:hypothetical protein